VFTVADNVTLVPNAIVDCVDAAVAVVGAFVIVSVRVLVLAL
jgi:hypothetical protein